MSAKLVENIPERVRSNVEGGVALDQAVEEVEVVEQQYCVLAPKGRRIKDGVG